MKKRTTTYKRLLEEAAQRSPSLARNPAPAVPPFNPLKDIRELVAVYRPDGRPLFSICSDSGKR